MQYLITVFSGPLLVRSFRVVNIWFHRILLVLTIGGGFTGLALGSQYLIQAWNAGWVAVAVGVFLLALHAYGVWVGLLLADGKQPIAALTVYFVLQLPVLSSPFIVYQFAPGLQVLIGFVGLGPMWHVQFGDTAQLVLFSGAPVGLGVNLFAAIILFVLFSPVSRAIKTTAPVEPPQYDY